MDKTCPYCVREFGEPEAREFLGRQFSEYVMCSRCEKKVYVVIQTKDELKYKSMNMLVSIGPMILALGVLVTVFLIILLYGLAIAFIPMLFIGGGTLGAVLFGRRWLVRRVYWKHASAQKSPFVE